MNYKVFLAFLGAVVVITFGCKRSPVDVKTLKGGYCFSKGNNIDSLFLNDDQTYIHRFVTTKGRTYENRGEWQYNSLTSEVTFEDFIFFNDEGPDNPPGLWYSRVRVSDNGDVRLMYSAENNIYYNKRFESP